MVLKIQFKFVILFTFLDFLKLIVLNLKHIQKISLFPN